MTELFQPTGSRRQRLWELAHRYHCPVIGVCFALGEMRELVCKVMIFPQRSTDYEVHCTAASECSTRTPLSSLLHKTLEKKFSRLVYADIHMLQNQLDASIRHGMQSKMLVRLS